MNFFTISTKISTINDKLHLPQECVVTIKELIDLEYLDNEICSTSAKKIFKKNALFCWMEYFIKDPKKYYYCLTSILDLVEHWQLKYTDQITSYAKLFLEKFFGYLHFKLRPYITRRLLLCLQHFIKLCKDEDVNSEIVGWCKYLKREVQNTKSIRIRQEMFALLGLLCKYYPEHDDVYQDVYRMAFVQLKYQLNLPETAAASKFEPSLVNGLLRCLSGILESFPKFLEISSTEELFNLSLKTFNPDLKESLSQYDIVRAGLELFSCHSALFIEQIKVVYSDVYSRIQFWLSQNNVNLQNFANKAFTALIETVTSYKSDDQEIIKFFINELMNVLSRFPSSVEQFACAAEGIGDLCALDVNDAHDAFRLICNKCDYIYHNHDSLNCSAQNLAVLILSISKFPKHTLNSHFKDFALFHYCHLLWLQFPSQSLLNQEKISHSIKSFLLKICELQYFNESIRDYIKDSLILCVSHSAFAAFQIELASIELTYINYLPIWKFLLTSRANDIDSNLLLVSNIIIKEFLNLISMMNLELNCKSDVGWDNTSEPDCPEDINLFVNFCGLFCHLLDMFSQECLNVWIPKLLHIFIVSSKENPLISGWYKLISKCLTFTASLEVVFDMDEVKRYANYLSNLSHSLLDETQVAAVLCLFSMPSEVCSLHSLFNLALNHGQSHSAIADIAIDYLNQIPQESIPCLNFYLGGKLKNPIEFTEAKITTRNKRRALKTKHLESCLPDENCEKVAFWLGSNDRRHCIMEEYALRGCNSNFFLTLNFPDMSLEFPLHKILPRVIDLCRFCESRHKRVAACELLHAMILIGLPRDPVNILKDSLMCVFKLACEIDPVILKLFSSLVTQLINWFTRQPFSDAASILLDELLSAAIDPHLPNLRQFAAKSISSYILVCIGNESKGLRTAIKRLCSLLIYPSSSKQLGVCLTLKSCYQIFIDNEEVLNTYIIQILWSCFQVLLTSKDPEVVTAIQETMSYYITGSSSHYDILCKPYKKRLIPSTFESDANIYQLLEKCAGMVTETNVNFKNAVVRAVRSFYNKFTISEVETFSNILPDVDLEPELEIDVDSQTNRTLSTTNQSPIPNEVYKFYNLLTNSEAEEVHDLNELMLKLKDPLNRLLKSKLSVLSSQLIPHSPKKEEYCKIYYSMLSAFGKCCESSIFQIIMQTAINEKQHLMDAEIEQLLKSFEGKSNFNNQISILIQTCFDFIFKDQDSADDLIENISKKFLCPLLNICNLETLKATIGAHLPLLLTLIDSCRGNLTFSFKDIITRKICFQILSVPMKRLPREELQPTKCYLNSVFASTDISNGRSLTDAIIESCCAVIRPDNVLSENKRSFVCAAYNCIITVSMCLDELKHFESYIFNKKFVNLNCLVEKDKILKFPFNAKKWGEMQKMNVSLRSYLRTHTSVESQSQYLNNSSLSYESSFFNLTDSQTIPFEHVETNVEIFMDDLGSHECYLVLVDALSYLLIHFSSNDFPLWLELLVDQLNSSDTCLNLKLLIGKVFCSLYEQLAQYSRFLIQPIINVLICHIELINSISAIVLEFISMILHWNNITLNEDELQSLSMLFNLLLDKAPAIESQIFYHQLQLIKLMLEKFKSEISIPFETILKLAKSSYISENIVSIRTVAILVTNDIDLSNDFNIEDYCSTIGKLITSKKREVYLDVAELFGMILKHICKDVKTFNSVKDKLNREIEKLSAIDHQFLTCICKISERCHLFGEEHISKVLSNFPDINKDNVVFALRFLRFHASKRSNDDLKMLKSKGLLNLVRAASDLIRFEIVEMLDAFLPFVEDHLFRDMFEVLNTILDQDNPSLRMKLYELYMRIFKKCSDYRENLKSRLLMGLIDSDTEIVSKLFQFFSTELMRTDRLRARFEYAFSDMYDINCEHAFVHYATHFILELTSHSRHYKDPVNDKSLGECTYKPLNINEDGRRYFSMTPRFIKTESLNLSSQNLDSNAMPNRLLTFQNVFSCTVPPSNSLDTQSSFTSKDWCSDSTVDKNVVAKRNCLVSPLKTFGLHTKFLKHSQYSRDKRREKHRQIQKFKKENYLQLRRSYSQGDFPDVQISFESIIKPLMALTDTDAIISKIVFSQIAIALHNHLSYLNEFNNWNNVLVNIINSHLDSTVTFNKSFVGVIFEIVSKLTVPVNPCSIRKIASLSGLHLQGIYCLEALYMKENSEDILDELCHLFIEINKYDFIKGLCHGEYANRSIKALQLQADCDLETAIEEYNSLLSETKSFEMETQRLFWNAGLRQCLSNLNDWKALGEELSSNEPSKLNYVKVMTRLSLMSNASDEFANEISKFQNEPHLAFPVSCVLIAKSELDNAQGLIKLGLTAFFSDWNLLENNLGIMRKLKLDDLVSYYEISNFLKNSKNTSLFSRTLNKFSDNLHVWDDVYWARKSMCIHLKEEMHDSFVEYKLDYAEAARMQNNNCLAKRLLKDIYFDVNENRNRHLSWLREFIEVYVDSSSNLRTALETLLELDCNDNNELRSLLQYLIGNTWQYLANSTEATTEILHAHPDIYKRVSDISYGQNISDKIRVLALNNYRNALDGAFDPIKINESLSQICNKLLLSNINDFIHKNEICKTMMCSTLSAIGYGGSTDHWPRLLQLLAEFPDVGSLFQSKASCIPSYMFLNWIDQTVACLAGNEGMYVQDILQDIAKNFPQAIVYPLSVSSSGILSNYDGFLEQLQEYIFNPKIKKWLDELERLNCFHITVDSWIKSEFRSLKDDCNAIKMNKFTQAVQLLYDKLWEPIAEISENRKSFRKQFYNEFEEILGDNGVAIKQKKFKEVEDLLKKLSEKIKTYTLSKPLSSMRDYSMWMMQYFSSLGNYRIEVPGQYCTNSRPILENHIYIEGFNPNVRILNSLRRPKQITIIGSDANEYKFLVKTGEDLRQDSRIIKLFTVMNQTLGNDSSCKELNCYNHTYNIIPMTEKLGLIEWCPNTEPLKDYLEKADSKKMNDSFVFYQKQVKNMSLYITDTLRSVSIENLSNAQNILGKLLLRNTLLNSAASNECFILMREKLLVSYGTLCACHYLLGIGDRHTSNMLLDVKYLDKFIGIDFGHAFDKAILGIALPEMVPFRLTCQLRNIIAPHSLHGVFHAILSKLFRALRKSSDRILDSLLIFLKEPLVDWTSLAGKLSVDSDSFLNDRIDVVRRKLRGEHPCKIFLQIFSQSHCVKTKQPIAKEIKNIVKGSRISRRNDFKYDDLLNEADQATCLIDLATDEYLLSKTWKHWLPYV